MRELGQRIPAHWFGMQTGMNLDPRFWTRVADKVRRTGVNDLDAAPEEVVRMAITAMEGNVNAARLEKAMHRGIVRRLSETERMMAQKAPQPIPAKVINQGRLDVANRPQRLPVAPRRLLVKA